MDCFVVIARFPDFCEPDHHACVFAGFALSCCLQNVGGKICLQFL
jgi:hypothetical protein